MPKSIFLPIGLLLALIGGMGAPSLGEKMGNLSVYGYSSSHFLIVIIFLVSGYTVRYQELWEASKKAKIVCASAGINLLVAPFLAVFLGFVFALPAEVYLGLAVMLSVPTTLSSAIVLARNAKGDESLALILTLIVTVLGAGFMPFTLKVCLDLGKEMEFPLLSLYKNMIILVIAPLLLGQGIRLVSKSKKVPGIDYLPSIGVILIVWLAVSKNAPFLRETTAKEFFIIFLLVNIAHVFLLMISFCVAKVMRLSVKEGISFILVTSQKTLPLAIAVLIILESATALKFSFEDHQVGKAVVVCVWFHLMQILIDTTFIESIKKKLG